MRTTIAMTSRLSVAIIAAVLLARLLAAAPPQAPSNPSFRGNKSTPSGQAEPAKRAKEKYRFYTIDLPEGGVASPLVGAYGINGRGLAAVCYGDAEGNGRTFLWWNGHIEVLDYQGSAIADLEKVSNRGVACGQVGSMDVEHAALFDSTNRRWTLLPDVTGKPMNFCLSVNDAGIAVGNACEGNYASQTNCLSWIWDGKAYSFRTIPEAIDQYTGPVAINDRGQMVGQYVDENGHRHSYLQEGSNMISVDVPGASDSYANDLNNSGVVVVSGIFGDSLQSYAWKKGVFTALQNVPGAPVTYAMGLNDHGDYSGKWCDGNFTVCHAFVAFRRFP